MSASSLWDLYSFEKHWEDAAKTFLEAEVGIDCFVQASAGPIHHGRGNLPG